MIKSGRKIGVVLAGCGVYDGSEIHESVITMLEIERLGSEVFCMAPDIDQAQVVNHLNGSRSEEKRNALIEAARIARGQVSDLSLVSANDVDGLIFPGGSGASKNLSDYALKGEDFTVNPEAQRIIMEMHDSRKPMGFICISPVIAARVLGVHGVSLTIGDDVKTAEIIKSMGARHIDCPVSETVTDQEHLIVSTPAYMLGPGISDIAVGIGKLVAEVLRMCG